MNYINLKMATESADYADLYRFLECYRFFVFYRSHAEHGNDKFFPYQIGGKLHHAVEVTKRTFAFEARAALDIELDDMCLRGQRRRELRAARAEQCQYLSLIHISEPTRLGMISYAVF